MRALIWIGFVWAVGFAAPLAPAAWAETEAKVEVETFRLDNGMEFLLVRRPELTTISAGWMAKVGSANERPGITGLSHLFEHMMFKGSHKIGTTNIERDLEIVAEQEAIQEQIRAIYREQRERWRRGEIEEPFDPETRPSELIELEQRFQALVDEQREVMIKDEFDQIYTSAGASSMNAFTGEDMTVYIITVPANKLELWFWMESDRLLSPVFREFYAERDVVHEERRRAIESSPTGKFDEQFNAMFWESHPYSWPVIGWPSDLKVISKAQADAYYDLYYAPNNLTGVLVGNFDSAEAKTLAERYFGRLTASERMAPDVVTLEMEQLAEKRMVAECDCQPQVEVRYHTVAFMHVDSYPLQVLGGLLNGQTGRLYKSLVLEKEIASSAAANQSSDKYAGAFSFGAEAKGDATPEQLESAWYEELKRIADEPIPAEELQKVKNQIAANAFRRLESPFFLMIQLVVYESRGDWNYINTWADKTLAVTEADVKRVVGTYFGKDNRAVAEYYRKEGAEAESFPPEVASLSEQQQQMVKGQIRQLRQMADVEQLQQVLSQIEQQKANAPPQLQEAMSILEKWLRGHIAGLESGSGGGE